MNKYRPKNEIECRICGKMFLPANPRHKICSDECRDTYYRGKGLAKTYRNGEYIPTGYNQLGENNNNFRHGVWTQENHYRNHNKGYCEQCGRVENLDVHHIDHNRMNYSPNNLITLCRSCHKKIHTIRDKCGKFTSSKV